MKSSPIQLSKLEGLGSVTMCGCGVVSLHIAGVTLRLEAGAFQQLEQMLSSAAHALQAREAALNTMAATKPISAMIQ
jgi:hypothetical protein